MGENEAENTGKGIDCRIDKDFEELGRKAKNLNEKVVISSLLPVVGHGPMREEKIVEVNKWLQEWCHRERSGFLDHGWWTSGKGWTTPYGCGKKHFC